MKLSIIIISYNTKQLLQNALNTIYSQISSQIEIIVVDNDSQDESPQMVKKYFPNVKLIKNKQNLGFSRANNQGIEHSQGEYILLLNSDTLTQKGALQTIIDFMDSNPQVGIASPKLLNGDGSIQPNGGSLPNIVSLISWATFLDDLPLIKHLIPQYHQTHPEFFNSTKPIGWISGAAMVLRRQTLKDIGNLDENIFMYSEDTELCLRAQKANWKIYTIASASVIHLSHGSGSKQRAILGEYQGLTYIYKKHKSAFNQKVLKLILSIASRLRIFIFGTILKDKTRYEIYKQTLKLA